MTSSSARILLTYDGSDASRAAFAPAIKLAGQMQAEVILLRVHRAPQAVWVNPDGEARDKELARLKEQWDQEIEAAGAELASSSGLEVHALARVLGQRWNISGEILAVSDEFDVDLICMATHGDNPTRQFFVGSTALDVLAQSKRPVVLTQVERQKK